ncbi:unnamed protein product [Medioppia subpectinata]|uniref:RING-type domain-containing protein n=1 Tax=Medioppia subpectinata TaxID=1979941 RepID=A0A7R9KGN4_9ACAR|nr:unnamed protein product [Medioppia subpectinata]CAG2103201.1 unnamed protein product [Medioppia subpectinata]
MPGYSVDRFPELSAEDREDYSCSICQHIFDTPVTTTCCLQAFCEDCINEWLNNNTTCPYDRKPLTQSQLSQPPRAMRNTLGRFKIRCDYWAYGCREVVKLDDLPKHTANCRHMCDVCPKCRCERTPGHDCVDALLAQNNELKKQLDNELVINRAAQYMDNCTLGDSCGGSSQQVVCADGHVELTPGHECLTALRAKWRDAQVEIDALKHELQTSRKSDLVIPSDSQLLAACKQHLFTAAHEVTYNNMDADMTDKTLAIIRSALTIQHNFYSVCSHVCTQLDLEYGTYWYCVPYSMNETIIYTTANKTSNLIIVKYTPITFIVYRVDTLDVPNLRARIKRNKIARNIDVINSVKMTENMIAAVKKITFAAIDRFDTIKDIAIDITDKMKAKYRQNVWQCVVSARDCEDDTANYTTKYIVYLVDQLHICD